MRIILLLVLSSINLTAFAQNGITWDPSIDVAASSFSNLHPRIVTDRSGNPMLIWGKTSSKQLHFSRWDSVTASFTSPILINPSSIPIFAAGWAGPDIASFGDTVYIVMKVTPEDTGHMYLAKSFDAGMSFDTPVKIDNLIDSISRFPTVATDSSGNPVIGYMNFQPGFTDASYVVLKSNDYGNSFLNPVLASQYSGGDVCDCCPASIVTLGNTAVMLYRDNLNNFRTMWAGVSTDNCQSFPNGISVDHTNWIINACPSSGPDGVIIGDSLYTIFMSGFSGDSRCYLNAASLSQMNSGLDEPLTGFVPGLSNQNFPRISRAGNKVGIVCRQSVNGTDEVALFYSDDITSIRPGQAYDTVASGVIDNCDITMTEDAVYVVWQDNNSGTVKFRKGLLPIIPSKVNSISNENAVTVYPSPAKDYFHISSTNMVQSVEMFDAEGKSVKITSYLIPSRMVCHFEAVNGIYQLKIQTIDDTYYYKKIVVAGK